MQVTITGALCLVATRGGDQQKLLLQRSLKAPLHAIAFSLEKAVG